MFGPYPRIHHLYREQLVPRPLDEVFGFFVRAGNLERIRYAAVKELLA